MNMERRQFQINTLDWNGRFGEPKKISRDMKTLGQTIAECYVYGLPNPKHLQEKMDATPLNVELFSPHEQAKNHLVDVENSHLSLRLDLQNVIQRPGEAGKFARYEIQINGQTGLGSAIANVCIPLGAVMTGNVVVDAFNESIRSQRMAVIQGI